MSPKTEYSSFFLGKAIQKLEQSSLAYHRVGCWVAIAVNPVFALSDYFNFPDYWLQSLLIRLGVSLLVFLALMFQKPLRLNSSMLVAIPLILISFQNAHMYEFAEEKDLLGQHLNYMALFIGASLFILWRWYYSVVAVLISAIATSWFVYKNPLVGQDLFIVHGGLLLLATGIFMVILIQTRFQLNLKTILAGMALERSKQQMEKQAMIIKAINESLEKKVEQRMEELTKKNKMLREYAFVNSHVLRAPLASIMGVVQLFPFTKLDEEQQQLVEYLHKSTKELDEVVRGISKTISEKE
jgi:signal transduction histidine kinase